MAAVLSQTIKKILAGRGISDPAEVEAFLNPDYASQLHDPFLLSDMAKAVKRIGRAVEKGESIVIYGDYDIDGITASALLLDVFAALGAQAASYIPDRFEEGYGLNLEAMKRLKQGGANLVVTVDCGVTAKAEVAWANQNGLDIIVTDHHAVPEELPEAVAVVNPKRPGDKYPFKELAGVGVAFKLAQALQQELGKPLPGHEKWLLDLVALGTVCDVVPLYGENRVLASYGLRVLNKTRRRGIVALAEAAGADPNDLRSYHLGYVLGPRMNAAGRLEHASGSLELLTTSDPQRARELATELDALNRQRRAEQAKIEEAANEQAEQYKDDPFLVLAHEDWNHGIVGIAAARVAERWGKPAIIMQIMGKTTKGSARSAGGLNLVEALRGAHDHLQKYGGHHYAAGLTLETAKIETVRRMLNEHAAKQKLEPRAKYQPEAAVESLGELNWDFYAELERLEPFGHGNPIPVLEAANWRVEQLRWVGADGKHLKLALSDGSGRAIDAIGFNCKEKYPDIQLGDSVKAVFQLTKNEFNGRTTLQINLVELK